jgi:hypothetical protein
MEAVMFLRNAAQYLQDNCHIFEDYKEPSVSGTSQSSERLQDGTNNYSLNECIQTLLGRLHKTGIHGARRSHMEKVA